MKKYAAIFRQGIMTSLNFRAETFLWIVIDLIPFIVMIFIWQAIYAGADSIQNYTLVQVMQYYLMIAVLERITVVHFESNRAQQIRDGKIDFYLTRPFSFIWEIYTTNLADKLLSFVLFIPAAAVFIFIVTHFIPAFTLPTLAGVAPQLAFLLAASHIIQFFFGLWIVLLTFWLEGSSGLEHFKWIVVALFSGTIMPIVFLPSLLQNIINLLPLKYLYAVPIALLQGEYTLVAFDYLYVIAVIIGMIIFTKFFWQKARHQYAAVGG